MFLFFWFVVFRDQSDIRLFYTLYLREVEENCPGTSRSFKNSNASMVVKTKFINTYRYEN